ncbi:MAG: response regulator [Candidatus Tectomicrobia bacterium]|uniref:Response regulator n=1 Tax=Tectimicrobiota bacterium TaxID=2528274 RepID=A0A933GJK0_UNCTE|nr:response regulator [Candidatus Tectomicrobia bacterium]
MQQKHKILIIEDNKSLATALSDILTNHGYLVEMAENAIEAQAHLTTAHLVLIDLLLPDRPGMELLKELREVNPEAEAIIITGYADTHSAIDALNLGACAYLEKPVLPEKLILFAKRSLEKWQLSRELKRREQEIRGLTALTGDILNERIRMLEEAEEKEQQLARLFRNISLASRSLDPVKVGNELLTQIVDLTGANHASFIFTVPYRDIVDRVDYFKDMKPFQIERRPGGKLDAIFRNAEPLVISDLTKNPAAHPQLVAAGIKSMAGYPLVIEEITYGALLLHSIRDGAFANHKDIISAFADLCIIPLKIAIAYKEAETSRQEWETTVNALRIGIVLMDRDRMIIKANKFFSEMVGLPLHQIPRKRICQLAHGHSEPITDCPLEKACKTGKSSDAIIDEPFLKMKELQVRIEPIFDDKGSITHFVHTFEDLQSRP